MQRAIVLFACAAIGLAADNPQFDVASVKPAAQASPGTRIRVGSRGGPGSSDPGQITYASISLKNLLMTAYSVKYYQISGPGWLDNEEYDIAAKLPPDTSKEQFALMLQNLLTERFKLTLHHETKDLPFYELVVAKNGSKLKPWVADPNAPPAPEPGATMMTMSNGRVQMTTKKQSLGRMADALSNQLGRPVVDKTGLTEEYDYTLEFSPEGLDGKLGALAAFGAGGPGAANPPGDEAPNLLTAVQEQLGLKLEPKKGPVELLVIDHADKTPTEN